MEEWTNRTVEGWRSKDTVNMDEICKDMKKMADKVLKKKYKRCVGEKDGEEIVEEEWMTDEIRTNIKKRRELNRKKRNSKT